MTVSPHGIHFSAPRDFFIDTSYVHSTVSLSTSLSIFLKTIQNFCILSLSSSPSSCRGKFPLLPQLRSSYAPIPPFGKTSAPIIMSASEQTHESNSSQSPATSTDSGSKKRSRSTVLLDANGNPKPVKRRAAKACAACRTRKVRCDVMQRYHVTADGEVTCSNCTMDNIKCVIEESKRRK